MCGQGWRCRPPRYPSRNGPSNAAQRRPLRSSSLRVPEGSERRAEFVRKKRRLFPRREGPAFVEPVVVDELGIRLLRPAPWRLIELLWKCTDRSRDRNAFRGKKRQLAFPIQPGRGDRRVGEPIERDVVEDVVSRQSLGPSLEDARDERQTLRVVIEHPRGE